MTRGFRGARVAALALTAVLPGAIKRFILRTFFGFRIGPRVRIGMVLFDCRDLTIEEGATIGHGVAFVRTGCVRIGKEAVVGACNLFRGGERIELDDYSQMLRLNLVNAIPDHDCHAPVDSTFVLGYGAFVGSSHRIDFTDRVAIGRRSMLAGSNSAIWTHNRRRGSPVVIGDFCYVGSHALIAPSATIPDCSIVAMGSVVSSAFQSPFTFIGGTPARIIRRIVPKDAETLFDRTRPDLPNEEVPSIPTETTRGATTSFGTVDADVCRIIGRLVGSRPDDVVLDRDLVEQGIDSLQLIVLREAIEAEFTVDINDDDWMNLATPGQIIRHLDRRPSRPPAAPVSVQTDSSHLVVEALEIGMPLTGRNNLAETPLLQRLGDIRWRHVSEVMGVPSREMVDEQGERLYATFFYVEMLFPHDRPMAAFGENDRLRIVSTIARYGSSMIDGTSYLMPEGYRPGNAAPFRSLKEAAAAGVPAVRLSNIFVKQFAGAQWLKKGRPSHPGFQRIPSLADAPDSYAIVKKAEKDGCFSDADANWIRLTDGPVRREYQLVPDRDLNGAGLVYFANYPMFLDICERDVLRTASRQLSDALIDRRTLVRRRSAYLNNAAAHDTLVVDVEPWIEAAESRINLHVNYRMCRKSDQRLMMVSTAEKTIVGASHADLPLPVSESSSSDVGAR